MKKNLAVFVMFIGIASSFGLSKLAVFAKDSYQLDKEADRLESDAANKEIKAAAEQNESDTAIDEGKQNTAARHARRAAEEQHVANKYAKKANNVEGKAANKAIKESYR